MKYQPPFGSTDPNASYVDANVPGAVRGSAVPGRAIEDPQRELDDFIAKSGFTPTEAVLQLAAAIQSGKVTYAVASGSANAWVVDPVLAVPAYAAGRVLWIIAPATNTSTTVNANVSGLGSRRIKKANGQDPRPSDLVSGVAYPTLDDGTNVRVLATLASDRLAEVYLGFHGDPVSKAIAPGSQTIIDSYTAVTNNLPGASQSGGIITIGTSGFYGVTANLASLMPTVGSGSYSYALSVSVVDAGGTPTLSIAALPVLVSTASFGSLAGSCSAIAKLTAGQRVAVFMRHNLPSTNIDVSVSLDAHFLGA